MARFKSSRDRLIGLVLGGVFAAAFVTTTVHVVMRYLAEPSPDVGDIAPTFRLDELSSGEPVDTSALGGLVLLVDFWETTCVGCVGATPKLNRLLDTYADRGFLVIGVNREPGHEAAVREFVRTRPVHYPVVVDEGPVSAAYGIYATPTVVLIGADGRIRSKHIGAVTETKLAKEIEAALAAARPRFSERVVRGKRSG